jgi:prevent-host-death family protein
MIQVNISTIKSRLSSYLDQVKGGEQVVISDRNQPIAMLVPYQTVASSQKWAVRLASLIRSGSIALAKAQKSTRRIVPVVPPETDREVGLTAVLLEERRSGR